jgi:hypothetical protein
MEWPKEICAASWKLEPRIGAKVVSSAFSHQFSPSRFNDALLCSVKSSWRVDVVGLERRHLSWQRGCAGRAFICISNCLKFFSLLAYNQDSFLCLLLFSRC